jgi:hypothetical protein
VMWPRSEWSSRRALLNGVGMHIASAGLIVTGRTAYRRNIRLTALGRQARHPVSSQADSVRSLLRTIHRRELSPSRGRARSRLQIVGRSYWKRRSGVTCSARRPA